jgi:hypothetical protein
VVASEAQQATEEQPVAHVVDEVLRAAVETGAPTVNAGGWHIPISKALKNFRMKYLCHDDLV